MPSRFVPTVASSRIGWARIWPEITSGARHPPARLENSVVIADIPFVEFCRGQASCSLAPIATPPSYARGMRLQSPGHSAPFIWFDELLLRQSLPIATLRAGPRSLRAELSEDGRVMDGTTRGALPAIHPSSAGQRRAVPFSRLCVMPRCVTLPLLVSTARWSSCRPTPRSTRGSQRAMGRQWTRSPTAASRGCRSRTGARRLPGSTRCSFAEGG